MLCPRCGADCPPENKFCKSCGAAVGAAGNGQGLAAMAAGPTLQAVAPMPYANATHVAPPPPPPPLPPPPLPLGYAPPQGPPPGMTPVLYQAYPGGPQQIYYFPAQGTSAHGRWSLLEGVRSKIREVASTDKLEGFSLRKTFSETFRRHGEGAMEEYVMVGSPRTTPPIELVETGWPKPWMFFRLLALFAIAAAALDLVWMFLAQPGTIPAIMILGSFSMPVAVLVFIFEMNTPRNVSVVLVGQLFVLGGVIGLCMALFEYQVQALDIFPGPVEEVAKLLAMVLLVRSVRYKYELNGLLIGCAVGAGFGCFETCAYALGVLGSGGFLQPATVVELAKAMTLVSQAQAAHNTQQLQTALAALTKAYNDCVGAMVMQLVLRGVLAPFMHVAWSTIAGGAFWRVKRDRPFSVAMLFDGRFLMAFAIPVLMHTLWDLEVTLPNLFSTTNQAQAAYGGLAMIGVMALTGVISWYVIFTMIQQGLHQVRDMQMAQLQRTLAHVESTLGLGTAKAMA